MAIFIDSFLTRCVLAEMMQGRPMFAANDDLQQLMSISSLCGTLSPTVWPDVAKLPRFYMLQGRPQISRCLLQEFSRSVCESWVVCHLTMAIVPSQNTFNHSFLFLV